MSLVTLGVADLAKSVAFYTETLGLPLSPKSVEGNVAFFELSGTWLGLFGRAALAEDAAVEDGPAGAFRGVSISHVLESEEAVTAFFEDLKKRGVDIPKPPKKTDWGGFSGYFRDPDGHLWEVAHNPHFWPGPKPV